MIRIIILTLLITLPSVATAKRGDPLKRLRCGYSFIKLGMTEQQVMDKCSPVHPTNRREILRINGLYVRLSLIQGGKFIRYILLRNNRVIELIRTNKRK